MKSPRNSVRKKTNNKIETMSKRTKQENIPSVRDAARSFVEAIIAERKAFELMLRRMKQVEKRTRADE